MSDDCCKGGSCGAEREKEAGCKCCVHEEVDVSSLGPEAVELAKKFDEVNVNLVNALKVRKEILELIYTKSSQSPELKEKLDKVLASRHPVLIQFVFGQ
jgi:hypothetical protein